MSRLMAEDIKDKLNELDSILKEKYRLEHPKKERDWRTYEQELFMYVVDYSVIELLETGLKKQTS